MGWNSSRRRAPVPSQGWSGDGTTQPLELKLVDLGLFLMIVVAPFFMGGRAAVGQLVLCVLATLTLLAWAATQCRRSNAVWRFTGAEPLLVLGLGLIFFQTLELSPELLATLSPRLAEILPFWDGSDRAFPDRPWRTISLTPADTWGNLIVIVPCVMLFFVLVQRIATGDDIRKLMQAVALGGAVMALFAFVQLLAGNGKFFWFYEHPMSTTLVFTKGAFVNRNHFADFLVLSWLAQFYLFTLQWNARESGTFSSKPLARSQSSRKPIWEGATLVLTGLAILLSNSRGGIVCWSVGMAVMVPLLWRCSLLKKSFVFVTVGVVLVSLSGTLLFGEWMTQQIEQNIAEITSGDVNELDHSQARRLIWEANLKGIREFPILGTGLGSHREVYWQWHDQPHDGFEYSHAENGFLQVALETGLVGLAVLVLLFAVFGFWCVRGYWQAGTPEIAGSVAVAVAGMAVTLTHSLSDFVWYAPACVNIVLVFAASAARCCQANFGHVSSESRKIQSGKASARNVSRWAWGASIPVIACIGLGMGREKLPEVRAAGHVSEYLRLMLIQQRQRSDEMRTMVTVHRRRLERIDAAVTANPRAHRVQFYAGLACLEHFIEYQLKHQQRMPLSQIREAALASFESPEDMHQWLENPAVMGEGRAWLTRARDHFQASLRLCPLQPRPYLELAELAWLDGVSIEHQRDLIRQAVHGRPHDARARFALGRMHFEDGDLETALEHWKTAFRMDPQYRRNIINTFAIYLPVSFFLENFDADLDSLGQLRSAYRQSEDQAGYRTVLRRFAEANVREAIKVRGASAEKFWLQAHACFVELGEPRAAYGSAKEALKCNPASYPSRQALGFWLYDQGAYREAIEHLTWCHQRRPDIATVQRKLERAHVEAERGVPSQPTAKSFSGPQPR